MSEPTPQPSTGLEQPRRLSPAQVRRARLGKLLGLSFVLLAVVTGLIATLHFLRNPRSEHGRVSANVVGIAPRVSGPIKRLPLIDDQYVGKGEVLFEIDPAPYELALRGARANRDAVIGELSNMEKTIAAQKAQVLSATALLAQAKTVQAQAEEAYQRVEPLLAKKFAAAETVDTARHKRDAAIASVESAQAQAASAQAAVQDIAPLQARLQAAEASLAQAELSVSDCTVRAPFNGRVVGLTISAGAFARVGVNVLTLIDTGSWHVEANFRESELRRIQAGDRADVEIMTEPGRRFTGEVESIGWGVTELPELPLAALPVVRRELDWVILAQDFPVRIRLSGDFPSDLLRVGVTATATIHTRPRAAPR
jgi:membrane fusion protein, multidrug efflux system